MSPHNIPAHHVKAMIISVGGTEEPLVTTITHHRPEFVSFFASQGTLDTVARVRNAIKDNLDCTSETTLVDNENELMQCYEKAGEAVARVVNRHYSKDEIMVDYTGGTKNMSVALALTSVNHGYRFSYVGGTSRTKGGVGIVESGHERLYHNVNPWDFLAVEERKQAALFFNSCQFKACFDLLDNLAVKAGSQRTVYRKLAFIVDGFLNWDLFRHHDALESFKRGRLEELRELSDRAIATFAVASEKARAVLEQISICSDRGRKPCLELAHDLFANADRRAGEGKIDDAILRLYRLVEMLAQNRLLVGYAINTDNVALDKIPAVIRDDYVRRYRGGDGRIKVPQSAAYNLLRELNDPLGVQFTTNEKKFKDVQSARNSSYLAHGFNSSKESAYQRLREFVVVLGEIDPDKAPVFPKLDFSRT